MYGRNYPMGIVTAPTVDSGSGVVLVKMLDGKEQYEVHAVGSVPAAIVVPAADKVKTAAETQQDSLNR